MDKTRIFKEFQKADWASISKELLAFALWWAYRYRWRSGSPEILPKGHELRDIVQHVITQAITGERKWDPDKGDLLPWLKDQVKSVIDALAKSASHRRESALDGDDDENSFSERDEYIARMVDPSDNLDRLTPEEILINKESDEERRAMVLYKYSALFYAIEGDAELEEVLDAVINGCELKARFLAQELNVPVENIYNRLKRLRRKAISLEVQK